jgi:hypothetical protein
MDSVLRRTPLLVREAVDLVEQASVLACDDALRGLERCAPQQQDLEEEIVRHRAPMQA